MKKILYWLEMAIAPLLSGLLVYLNPTTPFLTLTLFALGVCTTTLAEYIVHAFVLHGLRVKQHLNHHRRPTEKIYSIYWPLWLLILPTLLASPTWTAGILAGYWYYLVVHHSAHHDRRWLRASLLRHHDGHHQFANKNFGVSTTVWDKLFGTKI